MKTNLLMEIFDLEEFLKSLLNEIPNEYNFKIKDYVEEKSFKYMIMKTTSVLLDIKDYIYFLDVYSIQENKHRKIILLQYQYNALENFIILNKQNN